MKGRRLVYGRDSDIVQRIGALVQLLVLVALAGCRSTNEYNPFFDIADYDTVVVEDFEGHDTVGYAFAERVGRSLTDTGKFTRIVREKPEGEAILVRGKITRYSRGNPAMRLRYGHNIGNARFSAVVTVEDYRTRDLIATINLNETYEWMKDRSRITQDLDTLLDKAARQLADELVGEIGSGRSPISF